MRWWARRNAAWLPAGVLVGLLLLGWSARQGVKPWVYFGGPLIELSSPLSGARVPVGAVQLLVRFPDRDRVVTDTFRCLLNGTDVTERLSVAENGVGGSLYPLREGRNTLRVEVFGKVLWDDRLVEDTLEIEFVTRPLPPFDRAARPGEAPPALA